MNSENPANHRPGPDSAQVSPLLFSRISLCLAAFLFLVLYPSLLWFAPRHLPEGMGPSTTQPDFVQYYSGATVVRHGLWDSLYPTPRSDFYGRPSGFTPVYQTFLFNPANANQRAYYLPPGYPFTSDTSPSLVEYLPQASNSFRYIYPPPMALLFWPLSWFSFNFAAFKLWPTIAYLCFFITIFISSRIFRLLHGSISYAEGFLILSYIIMTYRGPLDITSGNSSPILAALITTSIYALLSNRLLVFSCSLVPLVLNKTIGLMWLPLLILDRRYRMAVLYLALLTIILNGIVFSLAGDGVYLKFFSLLPYIGIPTGEGIVPQMLHLFGFYSSTFYFLLKTTILAALYYGYWKNGYLPLRTSSNKKAALPYLVALLAGTMALFCLLNFSLWSSYIPNYLVFPFLGWLLQEACFADKTHKSFLTVGSILSVGIFASQWICAGLCFHLGGPETVEWYRTMLYKPTIVVIIPIFFLTAAVWRLFTPQKSNSIAIP